MSQLQWAFGGPPSWITACFLGGGTSGLRHFLEHLVDFAEWRCATDGIARPAMLRLWTPGDFDCVFLRDFIATSTIPVELQAGARSSACVEMGPGCKSATHLILKVMPAEASNQMILEISGPTWPLREALTAAGVPRVQTTQGTWLHRSCPLVVGSCSGVISSLRAS